MLSAALADDTYTPSPTYNDLASYLVSWTSRRCRTSEFERVGPGEASVRLQNRTGDLDPTNTGSPFYGELLALRQAKISFANPVTGGTAKNLFSGYLESMDFTRPSPDGFMAVAALVDGFELMANADVRTDTAGRLYGSAFAAQHVDDRIKAAHADAGWDATRTRFATGNVNVMAHEYPSGSKLLQVAQDAADAEHPIVAGYFMDKDGNAAFSGRGIRFGISGADPDVSYPDWVTRWRVGDEAACALDPTLLPIADLEWLFGKDLLYNDAVCAPEGASAAVLNANHIDDATSVDRYGRRSLPPILGLLTLNGTTSGKSGPDETKDMAQYIVNNYKVPRDRITSIEFHGQMDDGNTPLAGALWDFILNVEYNHIVEVHTVNPGGGGITGVDYFVEGISNSVERLNSAIPKWTMNLDLSPRARFATYP